ncbi:MAG: phosphonate C-P lyase system protein PhnG [Chloroflexi bacterium]|nr:phosphonate C-P lyase system protein PhnG [Chloroflexota bacterium]
MPTYTHDRRVELLAAAPATEVIALGEQAVRAAGPRLQIVRQPEVGTIVLQVREPVAEERFYLADVLVTRAEVDYDGAPGWAMRMGDDRLAALAAAVLDAAAERDDDLRPRVYQLCADVELEQAEQRRQEWRELARTIVAFEKLDQ